MIFEPHRSHSVGSKSNSRVQAIAALAGIYSALAPAAVSQQLFTKLV